MSAAWPLVPLGNLLLRSDRTVLLHPEATYGEVTVRMNGKGVVERRQVQGVEIASDRRYEASPDNSSFLALMHATARVGSSPMN